VVAPAKALAAKPKELSFVGAATIPQSGAIALQGMAKARRGDRVLINGAGGGSGAFAIQLARRSGAHVTGVDNAAKQDFMRSVGADETLDYRIADFTRRGPYDLILDMVASRSPAACRRALAEGGVYRCVGGSVWTLLSAVVGGAVLGAATHRSIGVLAVKQGPDHFTPLARQCVRGEVDVHVAATFGLDDAAAALAMVGEGRALGKVVVLPEQSVRDPFA
jgi:NADPH:quinone reductase-like Zn-dependent oxidoreductase